MSLSPSVRQLRITTTRSRLLADRVVRVATAVARLRRASDAGLASEVFVLADGALVSALAERRLLGFSSRLLVHWSALQRVLSALERRDLGRAVLVAHLDVVRDKVAARLDLEEVFLDGLMLSEGLREILVRLCKRFLLLRKLLGEIGDGVLHGGFLRLQVGHGVLVSMLCGLLALVSGLLLRLGLLEDEREHAYRIRACCRPGLGEFLAGRGGVFARLGGKLRQANRILGVVDFHVKGALGVIRLLLVMVRARLGVEPIVELLEHLRRLCEDLFRLDEIVHILLVRRILSRAVLGLVGLVLLVFRE